MNLLIKRLLFENALKLRFFSFFMLAGLMIILVVAGFFYFYITESMTQSYERQAETVIELYESRLISFIEQEQARLQNYYNIFGNNDLRRVVQILAQDDRYFDSLILDKNGIVQHSSDVVRVGYNYKGRAVLDQALSSKEPFLNMKFHPFENNLLIELVIPIYADSNELEYVAIHHLNPNWLEDLLEKQHMYEEGDIILFDDSGIIFLNIRDGVSQLQEPSVKPISLFDYGISLDRLQLQTMEMQSFVNQEYLVTYKKMEQGLGTIAKETSLADIDDRLLYMYQLIVILTGIAVLVYSTFGILLAKRTMKPIYDLTNQIHNRKQDDQASIIVKENSELSVLVHALNESWLENNSYQMKLLEEKRVADEANQTKSQFLANMSHEIRTPMNGIIGLSYLAISNNKDQLIHSHLEKIQQSANNLLGIINDILDYSKIEAGKLLIDSHAFYIREIIKSVTDVLAEQLKAKDIKLIIDISKEIPTYVIGDSMRLRQALMNLLGNAVKFTEAGSITLSAQIEERDSEMVKIIFSIRDTGIGIPKEKHDLLFKPFSQADGSTTRNYGGTGLGLTITKRVVESMGGQIWFESEPKQGSTFSFTIPFDIRTDAKTIQTLTQRKRLHVLIADDEPGDREVLAEFVTSLHCSYIAVGTGEEAIQEIYKLAENNRKPFDLILLDYKMPGLDGFETAARLRQTREVDSMPLIIMVTSDETEEIKQKAKTFNFDGFIVKPINQSMLFDSIIKVFGKKAELFSNGSQEQQTENMEHYLTGVSVLLVEDNITNQIIAKELLEQVEAHVIVANNGLEAVELVKKQAFDIIIMDIQMPRMDGHEATRRIRNIEKGTMKQIPIIALTAHAMKGDMEKSLEAGMDDYLSKPFEPKEFINKIAMWASKTVNKNGIIRATHQIDNRKQQVSNFDLPDELPGIQLSDGIKRIRGNKELYIRLLKSFKTDTIQRIEAIQMALVEGNTDSVKEHIHSVKGAAGNISAIRTMALCKEIEAAINEGELIQDARLKDIISELASEFLVVRTSIEELLAKIENSKQENVVSQSDAEYRRLLVQLKEIIEEDYFVDDALLLEIGSQLPQDEFTIGKFNELKQSLEEFNYEKAREVFKTMNSRAVLGDEKYDSR